MNIATIIVRSLVGLLFIFASLAFFFDLVEQPELEGDLLLFNQGLAASGYLFQLVKIIELLCGIAFLSGFFVPLAVVVIFPITVNILLVHLFLDPAGLVIAIPLFLGNLFLAYACRHHYRGLISLKTRKP